MIIETTIRTPQFKDGRIFDYTVQRGYLSTDTWDFEPDYHISGKVYKHKVSFRNEREYLIHRIS